MCVSVTSCERSSSKPKSVKTYLRSTMSQTGLTNLAILTIERNIAEKLVLTMSSTTLQLGTQNEFLGKQQNYIHGGDLAPNLGGTKKFFRGPISGKISIFRVKISDDLFFSHRPGS